MVLLSTIIEVGIATIPSREPYLKGTIESLLPQVDKIHVALNNYPHTPEFLKHPRIAVYHTDNSIGDAFKFKAYKYRRKGYFLTCDDDLGYAPHYVTLMISYADKLGIVSMHGRFELNNGESNLYKRTGVVKCLAKNGALVRVDYGGTGVMCIPNGILNIDKNTFKKANMADYWVGTAAKEQGLPIHVIPHTGKELTLLYKGDNTIFRQSHNKEVVVKSLK